MKKENGSWKLEVGRWKMEVEDGRWKMEDGSLPGGIKIFDFYDQDRIPLGEPRGISACLLPQGGIPWGWKIEGGRR